MKRKPQRDAPPVDADGVRVVRDERGWLRRAWPLLLVAVAGALAARLLLQDTGPRSPAGTREARERLRPSDRPALRPTPIDGPLTALRRRPVVRRRVPMHGAAGKPPPAPAADVAEVPPEIGAGAYIAALRESGETAGLAAFPPPGTRPPRSGVIVPDDYELPEGFARHYQSTDDGRRLEPILTLAPGYDLLDDAGEPVHLTDDRIVPPEFAPPDLPVRLLEVPPEPAAP